MQPVPKKWAISQYWRDVLFLNYKIDPALIQDRLPTPLEVDTFKGSAYLSIVPFRMSDIRFPWTPILPFSDLWEINLRTYVRYGEYSGVYFFTLDTDHHLAQWIANTFFHLPYRYRFLRGDIRKGKYFFESPGSFEIEAGLSKVPIVVDDYHHWMTERYCLFTDYKGKVWRGDNFHIPWKISFAKAFNLKENLREEFFPGNDTPLDSIFYSEGFPVYFHPFKRVF